MLRAARRGQLSTVWRSQTQRRRSGWSIVFAVVWMFGFLTWAAAGGTDAGHRPAARARSRLAVPLVFGALGGVTRRARRRRQHRDRGPAARRRVRAPRWSPRSPARRGAGLVAAMVAGVLVAFVLGRVRDQLPRRPGDRRRRAQRARDRPDELPVLARCSRPTPTMLNAPAAASSGSRSRVLSDIPIDRPGAVPPDDHRLPACTSRSSLVVVRRCSAPAGACGCARSASTRKAADTVGINVNAHPLLERLARRRDRRPRWRVLHAGLGRRVQPGDDRRRGLHRARRGHLRPVGPDQGDPRRPAVRVRLEPAERAVASSARRCRASSC